jgi:hypothetical protein
MHIQTIVKNNLVKKRKKKEKTKENHNSTDRD